jgi:hypothetical protein
VSSVDVDVNAALAASSPPQLEVELVRQRDAARVLDQMRVRRDMEAQMQALLYEEMLERMEREMQERRFQLAAAQQRQYQQQVWHQQRLQEQAQSIALLNIFQQHELVRRANPPLSSFNIPSSSYRLPPDQHHTAIPAVFFSSPPPRQERMTFPTAVLFSSTTAPPPPPESMKAPAVFFSSPPPQERAVVLPYTRVSPSVSGSGDFGGGLGAYQSMQARLEECFVEAVGGEADTRDSLLKRTIAALISETEEAAREEGYARGVRDACETRRQDIEAAYTAGFDGGRDKRTKLSDVDRVHSKKASYSVLSSSTRYKRIRKWFSNIAYCFLNGCVIIILYLCAQVPYWTQLTKILGLL